MNENAQRKCPLWIRIFYTCRRDNWFIFSQQDPLTTNATYSSWTLNSYIVSASINNSQVSNLKDPVVVTLQHQKPKQVRN